MNADDAASALAVALKAERLVYVSDVPGVMNAEKQILPKLNRENAESMIRSKVIAGGMIPKVESCVHAVRAGVRRAHILDGRLPHVLLLEIFTDAGIGTMVTGAG